MAARTRDPRTKEEFLDRMLSFDFDGDIRHLGVEAATIQRLGPNALRLKFPDSDQVFDLTVHKPREFAKVKAQARTFTQERDEGETKIDPTEQEGDGDQNPDDTKPAAPPARKRRKDAGQPRTRRQRQEARA